MYSSIQLETKSYDFSKLEENTDYIIDVSDGYMSIPVELKWCPYGNAQWRAIYISLQYKKLFGISITKNKVTVNSVDSISNASFSIYKKNIK